MADVATEKLIKHKRLLAATGISECQPYLLIHWYIDTANMSILASTDIDVINHCIPSNLLKSMKQFINNQNRWGLLLYSNANTGSYIHTRNAEELKSKIPSFRK